MSDTSIPAISTATLEAAARAAYESGYLRYAPLDTPILRWADISQEARESWRVVAQAAITAATKKGAYVIERVKSVVASSHAVEPRSTNIASGDDEISEWFGDNVDDAYNGGLDDGYHNAILDIMQALGED